MTKITRWDTGAVIHEGEGSIAELVAACHKLGILAFRANFEGANLEDANLEGANLEDANLEGANLEGANLEGASLEGARLVRASLEGANLEGANLEGARLVGARLVGARLVGASLVRASLEGANFEGANLEGANLEDANLEDARLPIWCRWQVSYSSDPVSRVHIGCKSMSVSEWDAWFSGTDVFDTSRDDERFVRIRANYLAMRAYLVALGLHTETTP
jgi:hypothetical protein